MTISALCHLSSVICHRRVRWCALARRSSWRFRRAITANSTRLINAVLLLRNCLALYLHTRSSLDAAHSDEPAVYRSTTDVKRRWPPDFIRNSPFAKSSCGVGSGKTEGSLRGNGILRCLQQVIGPKLRYSIVQAGLWFPVSDQYMANTVRLCFASFRIY